MAHIALYYDALIITVLFIFPIQSTLAQNTGNVTVGITITATENSSPWRSPSGDFAFGFQQLRDNDDLYMLAIWFDRIPARTIVWYQRDTNPVPRGSTVQLDTTDGLRLTDPQGRLVSSTDGLVDRVAYAYMNDTGNFVLFRSDSVSLWESFRNPADTMLPTQTLEINETLVSRVSETNFSQERFWARMTSEGNFLLNTKSMPTIMDFDDEYYSSSTSDANTSNSGDEVLFNERGVISVRRRNGQQSILSPRSVPPVSSSYHRATLNFDGVFTHYYHSRDFGSDPGWTAAMSWPDNICLRLNQLKGSGVCGFNSLCRIENQRPKCQCPLGFSLIDRSNEYGDCYNPNLVQGCTVGEEGSVPDGYQMREVADTDWPERGFETIRPSTLDNCRSACLNDCLCAAAVYRRNSCWKKSLPLSNGRVDTTLGATAFLKFRSGDIPNTNPHRPGRPMRDQKALIIAGSVFLGSSVFINLLLITTVCIGLFLIYKKKLPFKVDNASGANLHCFSYKELVQATNGFKEELGRGAFGIVYKGVPPNGSNNLVAVKKLDRVAPDTEKEFKAEVNAIGQTHHKNLVRLLGFCNEGLHRLLVYEYISNGTLAAFLFYGPKPSWSLRTQIALGVAGGLTYLHEECSTQIIHCDIKPQNILLDEYYNARISDFGLAKLLNMNQSHTITNIRGTKGYVAPEWFRNTPVTTKVDVYSFGVLLLEIICCRKSVEDLESGDAEKAILTDWVWDCFQEGRLASLVEDDSEALSDEKKLERFLKVGIWCVQEDASLRPTMRRALQMLEGIVEVARPPSPCLFSSTTA